MAPSWLTELISVPFVEKGRTLAGCDCWGMVRLALARGFHVETPDYSEDYPTTTDRAEIAALMNRESIGWAEVPLAQAAAGDVVLFRIQGQVCHAGLVIAPPMFLHCQQGVGTVLERWDRALWIRRVASILRHPALQGSER